MIGEVLALWCAVAWSHAVDEATARVVVRDTHVAVRVGVEPLGWLQTLSGGDLPVERIMVSDEVRWASLVARARADLATMRVEAEGVRLELQSVRLPEEEVLRGLAARALMAGALGDHAHGDRVEMWVEARAPDVVDDLSVTLPRSLGPVLVTFVRPDTAWASSGSTVRHVFRESTVAPTRGRIGVEWMALAGLVTFVVGWRRLSERRARVEEGGSDGS